MDTDFMLMRVRQKIDQLRTKYDATWDDFDSKSKQQKHSIGVIRRRLKLEVQTLILIEQLLLHCDKELYIDDEDAEAALKALTTIK